MTAAQKRPVAAIGLMSGTSMDGVDAALILTDGHRIEGFGVALTIDYDDAQKAALCAAIEAARSLPDSTAVPDVFAELGRDLARWHAAAVERLMSEAGLESGDVAVVGFHGHTLRHAPERGFTWQAGDGDELARLLGIPVVSDFRSADVAAGGEGAPLAPLYHAALLRSDTAGVARPIAWPVAVLNLGGVANVTWVPGPEDADRLIAFDTGPGNALIDDWVLSQCGWSRDENGALAASGQIHPELVAQALRHTYFVRPVPKSLDRDAFASLLQSPAWQGLSPADGAATLTALTAASVARAVEHFPAPPKAWYVCGGGRHNPTLMAMLGQRLGAPVEPVEALGWRGDSLEAEAFAYLAVRSREGLPLSLPGTTGVSAPRGGGRLSVPAQRGRAQDAW
ncbi:MAG: anhydro-N-acetylmuramic acid kinase [Alphaproteobacteria bacterium]|nr:MAG: anhydro-N-acetylmuramic acid kinase [Alphaproteobacteria bacterium]